MNRIILLSDFHGDIPATNGHHPREMTATSIHCISNLRTMFFPGVFCATSIQYIFYYKWMGQGVAGRVFLLEFVSQTRKGCESGHFSSTVFLSESTLLDNAGQDSVMNISFLLDVVILTLPLLCI